MKLAIYTDESRKALMETLLGHLPPPGRVSQFSFFLDYDEFIRELPQSDCGAMIVARSGAEGMEGARASRILMPERPLVWLSDDRAFGPESYRVGCSYFSAEPITGELLTKALSHCAVQTM